MSQKPVYKHRHSYFTTPATTEAWTEIIAALPDAAESMEIYDSSGSVLKVGVGAAGSESEIRLPMYITPGGSSTLIDIYRVRGERLAVMAVDTDAVNGDLIINFYA